jgi:hypothetical protein
MSPWWLVSLYCVRSQAQMRPEQAVVKGVMR